MPSLSLFLVSFSGSLLVKKKKKSQRTSSSFHCFSLLFFHFQLDWFLLLSSPCYPFCLLWVHSALLTVSWGGCLITSLFSSSFLKNKHVVQQSQVYWVSEARKDSLNNYTSPDDGEKARDTAVFKFVLGACLSGLCPPAQVVLPRQKGLGFLHVLLWIKGVSERTVGTPYPVSQGCRWGQVWVWQVNKGQADMPSSAHAHGSWNTKEPREWCECDSLTYRKHLFSTSCVLASVPGEQNSSCSLPKKILV